MIIKLAGVINIVTSLPATAPPDLTKTYCTSTTQCSVVWKGLRLRNYWDQDYSTFYASDANTPSETKIVTDANLAASFLGPQATQSSRLDGTITITTAGTYYFSMYPDNWQRVLIDGTNIYGSDTLGCCTWFNSGPVTLTAGDHYFLSEQHDSGGGYCQRTLYQGPDTGGAQVYVTTTQFTVQSPVLCNNNCYTYTDAAWTECLQATCIDCSTNIISASPAGSFTQTLEVSETAQTYQHTFQSSVTGCPLVTYKLIDGAAEYVGTQFQIDPTTGIITIDTSAVFIKTLKIQVTGAMGEIGSVDVTFDIQCGLSSVNVVAPTYTVDQTKSISGGDFTFTMPLFLTQWPISASSTSSCPITTLAIFDLDGVTTSTFFDNPPSSDATQITISLQAAYQLLVGKYDFKIQAIASGGKTLLVQGSLSLVCSGLTISPPIGFPVTIQYPIGAPGSTEDYQWSPFTTSESNCPVTAYAAYTAPDESLVVPGGVTYPQAGCINTPCQTLTVTSDSLTPIDVYIRAEAGYPIQFDYSSKLTITFACGPLSTTVQNPTTATPPVQYGIQSIASSMFFYQNEHLTSNALCPITDYLISLTQSSVVPSPDLATSGTIITPGVQVTPANKDMHHVFFIQVVADGGASAWTTQYDYKVGCGTYVKIFLTTDFVLTKSFEIQKLTPHDKYEILGFISESPYCKLAKYELVGLQATDGVVYPNTDSEVCSPTTTVAPICVQACPTEIEVPSTCTVTAISTENSVSGQCTPASAICNKIQVTELAEKTMSFKIRAYIDEIGSTVPVNTATAHFKESPTVTVTTYCGLVSTSITSVLTSSSHPTIAASQSVDILLDAGTSSTFDLYLDKMISTNPNCMIIDYDLSTSISLISTYTDLGIQKPVIVTSGYFIRLKTDLLYNYQFYIVATAKGGASNLGTAPLLKVNIICGSETISHDFSFTSLTTSQNKDAQEAIEIMFPLSSILVTQTIKFDDSKLLLSQSQQVLKTDKLQCDVLQFELYEDMQLSTQITNDLSPPDKNIPLKIYNEASRALSSFQFFVQAPMFKTLYIKAISKGNKFDIIPIKATVCGFERLELKESAPKVMIFQRDPANPGVILKWEDIQDFYIFESGINSLDQCNSEETRLYEDSLGTIERTSMQFTNKVDLEQLTGFEIQLKINVQEGFLEQNLFLIRQTKGQVKAVKQLTIEVCGSEKVLLIPSTAKLVLEYNKNKTDLNPFPLSSYEPFLVSQSINCPIVKYELVSSTSNEKFQLSNVKMKSDFSLQVDEKVNFNQELFIKATTEQGLIPAYLPLHVRVEVEQSEGLKNILNRAPNFELSPDDTTVMVTNQTDPVTKLKLSSIIDDENAPVEMTLVCEDIGKLTYNIETKKHTFSSLNSDGIKMEFDSETSQLLIKYPSNKLMRDTKQFEIELQDARGKLNKYNFNIEYLQFDQKFLNELGKQKNEREKGINKGNLEYSITAKISKMDQFGNMVVKFSSLMRTEKVNITHLNQTYLDLYIAPSNDWHKLETFNISRLNFTWNVTSYERDEMHFKLNFSNPDSISPKKAHDSIVFHIRNASYFYQGSVRPNDNLNPLFYTLRHKIPRQIYESDGVKLFIGMTKSTTSIMNGSLIGSFILNFLIAGSLSQLLAFINSLQLILHLPIMNVIIPANAISFFQIMIPIVLFDVLEGIDYVQNLFGEQKEESQILDQMKQLGYETTNTILNLGTVFVLMVFYFFKVFILLLVLIFCKQSKLQKYLRHQLIFHELIYLFSEAYIEYLLAAIIGLNVNEGSQNDMFVVHATTAIVNFICLIFLPAISFLILLQSPETLKSQQFKAVWFAAYKKVKIDGQKAKILYYMIFIFRRIIFIAISFWSESMPALQIQLLLYMSTLTMIFQGYFDPFNDRATNRMEFFNEICIYLCSLHLVCFTLFVPDLDAQALCGWSLIAIIVINMVVNLGLFFKGVFRNVVLVYQKYRNRCMGRYNKGVCQSQQVPQVKQIVNSSTQEPQIQQIDQIQNSSTEEAQIPHSDKIPLSEVPQFPKNSRPKRQKKKSQSRKTEIPRQSLIIDPIKIQQLQQINIKYQFDMRVRLENLQKKYDDRIDEAVAIKTRYQKVERKVMPKQ